MAQITRPMLLVLATLSTAQAAEPTGTLTLACDGTTQAEDAAKREPISMGIIVDFAAWSVAFGHDTSFPLRITDVTETTISFEGSYRDPTMSLFQIYEGVIDRVTGAVEATFRRTEKGAKNWSMDYSLKCKPTQRMF